MYFGISGVCLAIARHAPPLLSSFQADFGVSRSFHEPIAIMR